MTDEQHAIFEKLETFYPPVGSTPEVQQEYWTRLNTDPVAREEERQLLIRYFQLHGEGVRAHDSESTGNQQPHRD